MKQSIIIVILRDGVEQCRFVEDCAIKHTKNGLRISKYGITQSVVFEDGQPVSYWREKLVTVVPGYYTTKYEKP